MVHIPFITQVMGKQNSKATYQGDDNLEHQVFTYSICHIFLAHFYLLFYFTYTNAKSVNYYVSYTIHLMCKPKNGFPYQSSFSFYNKKINQEMILSQL